MKRTNAPPIPEGIRITLNGEEQEWKDVMQVFEDAGWVWVSGTKPHEKKICSYSTVETSSNKKIANCACVPITQELTATEFLNQYQGTIKYESGDWVVILKDQSGDPEGTVTQVVDVNGDSVYVKNITKPHNSIPNWSAAVDSIRPATPEEIPYDTKVASKDPDVYIWDGDVLPDEYWVENPNKATCEIAQYLKLLPGGEHWNGDRGWYKVTPNNVEAHEHKEKGDIIIVPYELWKSILEQPVSQAEPVAIKPRYHIDNVMDQNIAISCPTIKLWNAVTGLIPNNRLKEKAWKEHNNNGEIAACNVDQYGGSHCYIRWYEDAKYTIITAEEFLRDNGVAVSQSKWSIVTTDGVRVYEGGDIWWLKPCGQKYSFSCTEGKSTKLLRVNEEDIRRGYKPFSTYEAAEKYRQEQLEPPSTVKEMWKVGDILPSEWLYSGIEDYKSYKGKSRGTSKKYYIGHRCVEQVREGWALISDTADIWLAPKDQYPTYPKESTVKENTVPIGWKPGDSWRHKDGTCGLSISVYPKDGNPNMYFIDYAENATAWVEVNVINEFVAKGLWIINPDQKSKQEEKSQTIINKQSKTKQNEKGNSISITEQCIVINSNYINCKTSNATYVPGDEERITKGQRRQGSAVRG